MALPYIANVSASSTALPLITGVAGKRIRVTSGYIVAGTSATNVTFNSNSTAVTPLIAAAANGGICWPFNKDGWFDTNIGEGLTITTGSGAAVGVSLNYIYY